MTITITRTDTPPAESRKALVRARRDAALERLNGGRARPTKQGLFGRDELRPHLLLWAGQHVRLSVLPSRRTRDRYANLGRLDWHRRPKVLVRRTGDRVCAAVDELGRCASNNFFLVLPTRPHPLDLHGLCALLNSRFMTWYFRAIEPRRGRAFAELKIKHLRTFPLPAQGCDRLDALGRRCRDGATDAAAVDDLVLELFGLEATSLQ